MTKLIPVQSSVIAALAYLQGQLIVQFHDGSQYAYSVDYNTYRCLLACASMGKYFNTCIRHNHFGIKLTSNLLLESSSASDAGERLSEHESSK